MTEASRPPSTIVEGVAIGEPIAGLSGAIWADSNSDGRVDGYIRFDQFHSGAPRGYDPVRRRVITRMMADMVGEPPPPPPPPPPQRAERDGYESEFLYGSGDERGDADNLGPAHGSSSGAVHYSHAYASRSISLSNIRTAAGAGASVDRFGSVRAWQTTNGALPRTAVIAILEQCVASLGEVGPECLAAVRAGAGDFSAVPESARREFAAIYRDSCPTDVAEVACVERLQNAAMFRALPRGGLQLSPLKMDEGKRTLFSATIRDSGEIEGRAGLSSNVGFEPDAAHPGQEHRITVVPYSPKMCFGLRASDPTKVKIEPQPGEGRTIEPPVRICMTQAEGMEAIKYDPSWWVTPLNGNDLQLYLNIEHYVGSQKRNFPQEPWPIVVDVIPKPGLWARFDAFLEHATGTANLAANLAKAIGALISAIAAWGIWGWFKRRRAVAPETGAN